MNNLKIAIITDSFPAVSETFILNQITDLIDRGHQVTILSFNEGSQQIVHDKVNVYGLLNKTKYYQDASGNFVVRFTFMFQYLIRNIRDLNLVELFNVFNFIKYGKKALSLYTFCEMQWFLSGGIYDIIHAHFGHNGAFVANLKSSGFLKQSKLVTTFHGYDISPDKTEEYRKSYVELFQYSSLITINSIYTQNLLEKLNFQINSKLILPVGVDTADFTPKVKTEFSSIFNILFCGRLIELKGPHVAIKIIDYLVYTCKINDIMLSIVGDGPMLESLKIMVNDLNLNSKVVFLGNKTQKEIIEIMKESSLFIMPGISDPLTRREEAQGLVIQEAQAMELPVLVSNAGGMQYGMIDGETGFVIKQGDVEGFADKVLYLKRNPQKCEEMGKKGRAFVKNNFERKTLLKNLEIKYLTL